MVLCREVTLRCRNFHIAGAFLVALFLVACGSGGSGSPNGPATDTTPPTVPAGLTGIAASQTQVQLTWTASTDSGTGVAGYRIFRGNSATALATVTGTTYSDTGLTPSTNYSYVVRAFDNASPANESASSAAASVTTLAVPDTTPPTVPAGLTAIAASQTEVRLTWTASSDSGAGVAGYRVFRDNSATPLAMVTGTTYLDTGLAANTAYSYTVRAFDNASPANESTASAAAGVTTLVSADTTPPTVPSGLSGVAMSDSEVRLTWTASTDSGTGVAGYRIFRDGSTTPQATVTGTTYLDAGLAASTTYSYTVRAFDNASPTNQSAVSTATSVTTLAPASGLDVRPSNVSCLAGDAPDVSASFALQQAFTQLTFTFPVAMIREPSSNSTWYVVQQTGEVKAFSNVPNVASSRDFIDLSGIVDFDGNERGLIGMVFHPDYPANPRVYLSYTRDDGTDFIFNVVEFQTLDGGVTLDPSTARPILTIHKPGIWHHGGNIAFGTDGYLYLGTGRRRRRKRRSRRHRQWPAPFHAAGQDAAHRRQRFHRRRALRDSAGNHVCRHGAVQRRHAAAFTQNCPEIYAYGFRNPWRWSFDRANQRALGGRRGPGHVGGESTTSWPVATTAGVAVKAPRLQRDCGPNAAPASTRSRNTTTARALRSRAGIVYRGTQIPALVGRYVFGDFGSGHIWHIGTDTAPTLQRHGGRWPFHSGLNISSFAEGAMASCTWWISGGRIHEARAAPARAVASFRHSFPPPVASSSADATQPASGLIPYAPNAAVLVRWRRQDAVPGIAGRPEDHRQCRRGLRVSPSAAC